jgi:hypothetical protein
MRFVTEQQQAFGITIQAADGINVRREAELGERAVRGMLLRELGEHVEGLVEGDEHYFGTVFSATRSVAPQWLQWTESVSMPRG